MRKEPELRFDGFDGEWEEKKIDDLARFYSGGTPSSRNSTYYNGTIPFIRSGEIHSACTELFISEEGLLNSSAKMVDEGDLVYALYGATSGEADIIKMSGAINQAILAIKLYDNYNSVFVLNYLNKNKEIILNKYLQGGQGNLSAQIVRNLNIKIPFFGEQEKIGDLFKNIDSLIEKQEDKVSKMEDFKKSMLQKMFPKKDELVPEFRFDGFYGEWSPMFLKDLVYSEYKGKAMADKLILGGSTEYLDTERLNGGAPVLVDNDPDTNFDDILILWDGSKAGAIYTKFEGILGSTLRGFKINDDNDSYFIYSFLKMNENLIENRYRTPNIPHVVKNFSKVFEIKVTSFKEQQKIGQFFQYLDTQIENEEKLLESYKIMKKSLLQKMFV